MYHPLLFLLELNWQHPHWSSCLKFCLPLVCFQHSNQSDRVCVCVCVCIVCQIISLHCLNSSHDCDDILPCSAIMKQSSMIWSPITVDLICHSSPLSCPVQWEHFTLGLCCFWILEGFSPTYPSASLSSSSSRLSSRLLFRNVFHSHSWKLELFNLRNFSFKSYCYILYIFFLYNTYRQIPWHMYLSLSVSATTMWKLWRQFYFFFCFIIAESQHCEKSKGLVHSKY